MPPMEMRGRDIVCISTNDWEQTASSRYARIMERFSLANRVLYVGPSVNAISALIQPSQRWRWTAWRKGPKRFKGNLHLFAPPPSLPLKGVGRPFNRISYRWIGRLVHREMMALGFENPVYFLVLPHFVDMLPSLPVGIVCYDCADEHAAVPGRSRRVIRRMEQEMIRRADLCFASSRRLFERLSGTLCPVYWVPNGADSAHFSRANDPKCAIAPEMAGLARPIAGFVGVIRDGHFDWDLLKSLPEKWRGSIVLIGPDRTILERRAFRRLRDTGGIHWLGPKPYENLPEYLRAMDVCLIPYRINELTRGVYPLKLLEYLAAGKPVVSTDLPELRGFEKVVYIAGEREGFSRAMDAARSEDGAARCEMRVRIAEINSWDARAAQMAHWLKEALAQRGAA